MNVGTCHGNRRRAPGTTMALLLCFCHGVIQTPELTQDGPVRAWDFLPDLSVASDAQKVISGYMKIMSTVI